MTTIENQAATTEGRLPGADRIDQLPTAELVAFIHEADQAAFDAVSKALAPLARLIDEADRALNRGGTIHYFGAGTSGRLGVLDAAELIPTYSAPPTLVQAHLAGGEPALTRAIENSEDSEHDGEQAARSLDSRCLAVGLAASGSTPYVAGALSMAHAKAAKTALITSNPNAPLAHLADIVICAPTGPEVVSGSTRMKAGTALKQILNSFSTALMIRQGRTFGDLMVAVQATNAKLRARSVRILTEATGLEPPEACRALENAGGDVRTAIVATLTGVNPAQAHESLERAGGSVRQALTELRSAR